MKTLFTLLAAATALSVGALAPAPAAAMDDQEDLTECIELDWWGFDIGDCPAQDGSGGGGSSGEPGYASGADSGDQGPGDNEPMQDDGSRNDREIAEDEIQRRADADDALREQNRRNRAVAEMEEKRENEIAKQLTKAYREDPFEVSQEILDRIRAERKEMADVLADWSSRCEAVSAQPGSTEGVDPGTGEFDPAACWKRFSYVQGVSGLIRTRLDRERGSIKEAIKGEARIRVRGSEIPPPPPRPPGARRKAARTQAHLQAGAFR